MDVFFSALGLIFLVLMLNTGWRAVHAAWRQEAKQEDRSLQQHL